MENLKIVEYEDKYEKRIKEFIKEVTIGEFGFEEWKEYIENKDYEPYNKYGSKFVIVLNSENRIIGTCGGLKQNEDTIKLNGFYVLQEYRKNGIGKKMYELILEYAKKCKYRNVILTTNNKFDVAIHFYEKRGFEIYKIEDDGRIRYRKEL